MEKKNEEAAPQKNLKNNNIKITSLDEEAGLVLKNLDYFARVKIY